nr:hypothetical protein [Nonlabens ulvanivorans]
MRLSGIEITKNDSSYTIQCLLDDEVLYFKTSHIFLYEEQVSLFDAFVIAVIPVMIERQEMLYVDGAVDSFLFRQLNEQILPRLSKINDLQDVLQIQSLSDVIHQFDNQNRVTGVSCGVDSMATIKNLEEKKTQLDYLAFFDAGSHGSYGTKNSSINYEFRKKNALEFAKKLSYELIEVRTNAHKFLTGRFKSAHSFLNLSCAFATQGLINHYYYASAYAIGQSTQQSGDTSNYDHIILPFLESSYFKTSSTLGEINRLERIELYLIML